MDPFPTTFILELISLVCVINLLNVKYKVYVFIYGKSRERERERERERQKSSGVVPLQFL